MGLEGESAIEDGAEVGELGDFGDWERGGGRGEVHGRVRRSRRCVGVSWKTTILDLREEIVRRLRSDED